MAKTEVKKIDECTISVAAASFPIEAILHSGQVFRFFKTDEGFDLVVGDCVAHIRQNGDRVLILSRDIDFFYNYFDFDTDYEIIAAELSKFPKIAAMFSENHEIKNIRILRAPFVEVVISFIISANNNIRRFTKTLNQMARQFGLMLSSGHFSFPRLSKLANATQGDFSAIGCGYRARYLVAAVRHLAALDAKALSKLNNADLMRELEKIPGVGPKVAACVMLFSNDFHRLNVAPRDTWILQAINDLGADSAALLNHPFAGVAQQYVYYYLQHLRKKIN
jgi:N-glycosylase/DNA lyase